MAGGPRAAAPPAAAPAKSVGSGHARSHAPPTATSGPRPRRPSWSWTLIRGKKAADALSILRFTKKSIARDIEKTLRSAIANAVLVADRNQKRRLDEEDLVVSACFAGQGPSQKRVRPAPMGRAYRIIKRTAHITVQVAERE